MGRYFNRFQLHKICYNVKNWRLAIVAPEESVDV